MSGAISAPELTAWLVERVATYTEKEPGEIGLSTPLADCGLDSVYALVICGDIEDHLGMTVEPTLVWDHPTVNALVEFLTGQLTPTGR